MKVMFFLTGLSVLILTNVAQAQDEDVTITDEVTDAVSTPAAPNARSGSKSDAAAFGAMKCTQGNHVRTIEIAYDDATTKLPCRVNYVKETENPGQTVILWSATNQVGYCEEKAEFMANKLESSGWNCAPK